MADPDRYLTVARAFLPVPDPDGGLVFASDLPGHPQIYRQAGPDRFPIRLSTSRDRTLPIATTPFGLLARVDQGGNELWQLGFLEAGELRLITTDRAAIHRDVTLAEDRRSAVVVTNPGGQADWVVARLDLATGELSTLLDRGGSWACLGVAPDGTIAVAEQHGSLRNDAYLLHPDGELVPLLPETRVVGGAWWASGRLYVMTDAGSGFVGLVEVDPRSPAAPVRTLFDEAHDLAGVVPSDDGTRAALVVNDGTRDRLEVVHLTSSERTPLATPWPGVVYGDNTTHAGDHVAWLGDALLVAWESPTHPAELLELPTGVRWTSASGEPLSGLVEPEDVTIPGHQGLQIPALWFRSTAPRPEGLPRTTVALFHGGPEGQSRANYQGQLAVWIAAGFDVLAPNVRGSTGYGYAYASLDDRERRWDGVRDGVQCGRWLKETGRADRLVAMGASYGGFMTLAVIVEAPDLWDAAVDIVGIGDWHSFFRNTSGWRRSMRAVEYGDPELPEDAEFLARFSPLRQADRIRAHLLVIHGRNDPRVPVSEAGAIAEAVAGSELMVFEDEGHGLTRHANRARAYGRALAFATERLVSTG
ncbi:MAG: prolyl oligopeptidase family serine peptidase [Candidatus Dormiibacterota bacterium]